MVTLINGTKYEHDPSHKIEKVIEEQPSYYGKSMSKSEIIGKRRANTTYGNASDPKRNSYFPSNKNIRSKRNVKIIKEYASDVLEDSL